jgi:PPOX class probable F420-dependent enzyme
MAAIGSVIPEDKIDILESTALAHVATIGPDGEPQVNPVWFAWDGSNISFAMSQGRQKFRNLERDPRIAISILDPANPYRYLEIRGRVIRYEPDTEHSFVNTLAKKYLNLDETPVKNPDGVRVIVEPDRTSSMG